MPMPQLSIRISSIADCPKIAGPICAAGVDAAISQMQGRLSGKSVPCAWNGPTWCNDPPRTPPGPICFPSISGWSGSAGCLTPQPAGCENGTGCINNSELIRSTVLSAFVGGYTEPCYGGVRCLRVIEGRIYLVNPTLVTTNNLCYLNVSYDVQIGLQYCNAPPLPVPNGTSDIAPWPNGVADRKTVTGIGPIISAQQLAAAIAQYAKGSYHCPGDSANCSMELIVS